jgi:hypothetical protein
MLRFTWIAAGICILLIAPQANAATVEGTIDNATGDPTYLAVAPSRPTGE